MYMTVAGSRQVPFCSLQKPLLQLRLGQCTGPHRLHVRGCMHAACNRTPQSAAPKAISIVAKGALLSPAPPAAHSGRARSDFLASARRQLTKHGGDVQLRDRRYIALRTSVSSSAAIRGRL